MPYLHSMMRLYQLANTPIESNDPSAHAEANVIRKAAKELNNYRLPTHLYTLRWALHDVLRINCALKN